MEPKHVSEVFPQVHARLLALIREGVAPTRAAALCEPPVAGSTLRTWLEWGAEGDEPFATFLLEIEAALGQYELRNLSTIRDHARGFAVDPDTGEKVPARGKSEDAKWLLERKFPQDWGRVTPEAAQSGAGSGVVIKLSFARHDGNDPVEPARMGQLESGDIVDAEVVEDDAVDTGGTPGTT